MITTDIGGLIWAADGKILPNRSTREKGLADSSK